MADQTLDSTLVVLVDGFHASPKVPDLVLPQGTYQGDFFLGGDAQHNVATPSKYVLGQKAWVYNQGRISYLMKLNSVSAKTPGWTCMTYLKYIAGAETLAALSVCVPSSATTWYTVTGGKAESGAVIKGPAAVAISAMTTAYYGWFWTGGVCPCEHIYALNGNLVDINDAVGGAVCVKGAAGAGFGFAKGSAGYCTVGWSLTCGS